MKKEKIEITYTCDMCGADCDEITRYKVPIRFHVPDGTSGAYFEIKPYIHYACGDADHLCDDCTLLAAIEFRRMIEDKIKDKM